MIHHHRSSLSIYEVQIWEWYDVYIPHNEKRHLECLLDVVMACNRSFLNIYQKYLHPETVRIECSLKEATTWNYTTLTSNIVEEARSWDWPSWTFIFCWKQLCPETGHFECLLKAAWTFKTGHFWMLEGSSYSLLLIYINVYLK